jgi:hypothetical protein
LPMPRGRFLNWKATRTVPCFSRIYVDPNPLTGQTADAAILSRLEYQRERMREPHQTLFGVRHKLTATRLLSLESKQVWPDRKRPNRLKARGDHRLDSLHQALSRNGSSSGRHNT